MAPPAAPAPLKADLLDVDSALARILDPIKPLTTESLDLQEALGRVLAEAAHSELDLPPFDQSAVDGYALRQIDIADAPCKLPIGDTIAAAARSAAPELTPGTASRIFTGGWLPATADTVVRQELTERNGDRVGVLQRVDVGVDIRRRGEELRRGDVVAGAGQRITPGLLGALAMGGIGRVRVARKPRVLVLVTGDEVAAPGQPLSPGQIADANGPLLVAYLTAWGIHDVELRYVPDHFESVCSALENGFAAFDLVVTTGGVSVGDHDHVPAAALHQGARTCFWKVAQKPGMPLYVARRGDSLLFGLPGNPASVLVNLVVYVRPALNRLEGVAEGPEWAQGVLAEDIRAETTKTFWLRMQVRTSAAGINRLLPLPRQASHMLSNLAQAAVLVRVPPSEQGRWAAGSVFDWIAL